jgi:hypothetical protein
VLLDQGYGGLKAGSFVVLDDGAALWPIRLAGVSTEGDRRRLHWEDDALAAGADLAIADLKVHGDPRHAMALARRAAADELAAGEHAAEVVTPGVLGLNSAALFVSGSLKFAARIIHKSGARVTWSRGFGTALRRSDTLIYPGASVGTTSATLARGSLLVSVDGSGFVAGDSLLIADAAGVEWMVVAAATSTYVRLAQPLPRTFRPVSSLSLPVELYRVRLPVPGGASAVTVTGLAPATLLPDTTQLVLDRTYEGLVTGSVVVVSDGSTAPRARRVVASRVDADDRTVITLDAALGSPALTALRCTVYGPFQQVMRIEGFDRAEATLPAGQTGLTVSGAVFGLAPGDRVVIEGGGHAEGAAVASLEPVGADTRLHLVRALRFAYPLAGTVVLGNTAAVTHGARAPDEVLGSGDRAVASQRFALRRCPVSQVADPSAGRGVRGALEVLVGDERWTEVETLADSRPDDRHYMVEADEAGTATLRFGDGRHGATLPTGRDNVRARYRVGLGRSGNVPAGMITQVPEARGLVQAARHAADASGGADRETVDLARRGAGLVVRTLDRAVSLADHTDLALSFAGIAKARTDWSREIGRTVVAVTVAPEGGGPLDPERAAALHAFLEARRSPRFGLVVREYQARPIRLVLDVTIHADALRLPTLARVRAAFGREDDPELGPGFFHFDRRSLGETLTLSEIYALVEAIPGVDHALATAFRLEADTAGPAVHDRIVLPPDALATGGHDLDPTVGVLVLHGAGGVL